SIIMIPESQEKMAGEIRTALGLSFEVTLNSAIKYALFHAQNQGIPVCKLKEYPSSLSSYAIKVKVTPDTWYRLKESNAIEQLSECAVTGIELLHKQLISVKKNSDEHS
ncbi:MAG: hypothetical protein SAK29_09380, partial [Scytonema sp. PMC 1069.18]|nr:hypothetical protein [Scytonema sp. PMC 1069.18]